MIPVGEGREGRFLIVFLLQYLTFSGFLAYHEIVAVPTDAITTMLAILVGMAAIGFVSAINTVAIVEGIDMLAERYLKRRYQTGKEEGRAEGREEGREEGIEIGLEKANREWYAWNQRRMDAEQAGEAFNEPPPFQKNGK